MNLPPGHRWAALRAETWSVEHEQEKEQELREKVARGSNGSWVE